MRHPVSISRVLLLIFIISKASCQSIQAANDKVVVDTLSNGNAIVSMDENNHDFEEGSTPYTLLFKIIDVQATPLVSFLGSPFSYDIQQDADETTTYLFYASQSFDYETQERQYRFNLDLNEQNLVPFVTFNINNIDDEQPSLTSPQCTFDENTIYTAENSTCFCTVSDPDGWLASMTFEIVPNANAGNEDKLFALDYRETPTDTNYSFPVYVIVKEQLNYQAVTFYLFDIRAKDGAGHITTPNELVRAIVNVNDLPDTPPEWTDYFTFRQFNEQEEQSFTVTAVDGDHGLNYEINYAKLWEDDEEADYISIDTKTGQIDVKKIDRDKNDMSIYNFQIMAYEVPDAPLWNTTLAISFYIIDIDNNSPLVNWIIDANFDNVTMVDETDKVTEMSFLENFAETLNLTIFVQDIDTGDNARFTIELEDVDNPYNINYTDAFMIIPTAGYRSGQFQISVRNATFLDYEVSEWDHFSFNVLTKGFLNETKQDKMLVEISLIDWNDELPIFPESDYKVSINETAKNGDFIIQVMATDRDAEDANLTHTLIPSTYTSRVLRIETVTGEIYVNADNAFDFDTVNPIFVQVAATDKADHTTIVPLTITLLDVNNKAPSITVGDPINVDENQNSTTLLNATITASDVDTTAKLTAEISWENSYAMKNSRRLDMTNETISQHVRFLDVSYERINDDDTEYSREIQIDLVVNVNNPDGTQPDFELYDSLYISLVVTDWNTDPEFITDRMNTSALILISINDINDNAPYFPEADYPEDQKDNRTVQEMAHEGTSVGSISAIDPDVGDTVTYACEALDPNFDWVDVNERTGAFTVKDTNTIDADTHMTFYFNYSCTASDNGFTHTSPPLTVRFYIIDTNNKVPEITIEPEVYVDEKSIAETIVTEIGTYDEDRDIPFHTVECSFTVRNDSCFRSFEINNNVLIVRTGGDDINRDEKEATYVCTMTCVDNPDKLQNDQTPHTLEVPFTIHLRDINDHTPEVVTEEITTTENVNGNDIIGIILAKDIDEGDNAEIVFNISSVTKEDDTEISDLFVIETDEGYRTNLTYKQANLVATDSLRGHYGTYTLKIGVTDKGEEPNSAFYDVILEVNKFNFESPRFIFPSTENQAFVLLSSQEQNSPLIFFRNTDSEYLNDLYASDNADSDVCEKWDIFFTFNQTSPEDDTIFTIAKNGTCTGQLQINNRFSTDEVLGKTYDLKLTAHVSDGERQEQEAPYTVDRNIVINFLDNNQKPVFDTNEWAFEFFEENITQTIDLEYKATYEVEDNVGLPVFYYLISPNETISRIFKVDITTGKISLAETIDYETDEQFEFQIVASNDSSPTSNNPKSYLNVTCNVIDINDNVPQWARSYFFGAIMSGYINNTPILTVEATDADKIDQGKLTYFVNGDFSISGTGLSNLPSEPFTISSTTGEVKLNFQVDGTMAGYFQFKAIVWDVKDDYGNGPHSNTTNVTIFIINSENTVDFRFYNTIEEIREQELQMLDIISTILGYDSYLQNVNKQAQDGVELDDQSYASLYFINSSVIQAVESDTILRLVSNINIFSQLVGRLKNETGLNLMSFPSTSTTSENLEQVLRAWLVGVSVVLGALCLILLVTFILKTRELNNRITSLTTRKFGSQESGLNRLGISAPTTNKHAIEGSNPVFNLSSEEIKKDMRDFDNDSIRSGDSDLIGVEDSPQFDYGPNKLNGASNYF